MLTKKIFIDVISKLQEEDEKVEKLEVALTKYYRDSGFVFRCNGYSAAIIKMLKVLLGDDIDLVDWWYHEAYYNYLESGDIESISNFNNDGSIDGTFRTSGDVFDYIQVRRTNISESVKIGLKVKIVLKADQPTGKLTEGVVLKLLTNSSFHPHGIKVMPEGGQGGRVQELIA